MPNFSKGKPPGKLAEEVSRPELVQAAKFEAVDDLEISSRVMDTIQRQISDYRLSIEKVRALRK